MELWGKEKARGGGVRKVAEVFAGWDDYVLEFGEGFEVGVVVRQ